MINFILVGFYSICKSSMQESLAHDLGLGNIKVIMFSILLVGTDLFLGAIVYTLL